MLKLRLITYLIVFFTTYTFAQQADEIIGKYHLPNDLDVEIFKYNGKYFGEIIALNGYEDGQTNDIKNPDKSKHNEPLIGKVIINNLEFDKDEKEWVNGSMYGPEKGMIFNLKIIEIRLNEVEVVGSKFFFWKTIEWERL
ncbi:MAG: DUF2147 domain-containing protein [Bacteroidales bacterium]|nr:DUF2147 domain-containing protein [Bacteroidales bacterium]